MQSEGEDTRREESAKPRKVIEKNEKAKQDREKAEKEK